MLEIIYNFFESIGKARAAGYLATLGHYELARQVMLEEPASFEVHP